MLVLSRKENEGICLGEGIVVRVIGISKGVVKLGVEAPKDVLILRSELAEAVKDSNITANQKIDPAQLDSLSKRFKPKP
jgi:carbon storage regulator